MKLVSLLSQLWHPLSSLEGYTALQDTYIAAALLDRTQPIRITARVKSLREAYPDEQEILLAVSTFFLEVKASDKGYRYRFGERSSPSHRSSSSTFRTNGKYCDSTEMA